MVAGIITIFIDFVPWWIKVGLIALPAIVYFLMLIKCDFPVQERVASGVSYKEMLGEFGVLGAAVVGFLVTLQLCDFFRPADGELGGLLYLFIGIGVAIVAGFGIYTKALGSMLMFVLILIMMPLATTEIGTDGWITAIMEGVAHGKFHPGWILVYTSAIMMVLRFYAGPIVHKLSPLGLLTLSAVLAIAGLAFLSFTAGAMIFVAATLYGVGKTFFWPTMLGVVAEQTPKGGALTLNAISGIGMLAVGTLGFPYIGTLQAAKEIDVIASTEEITSKLPDLVVDGKLTTTESKKIYEIIPYNVVNNAALGEKIAALEEADQESVNTALKAARARSNQGALMDMALFPGIMLVAYIALVFYFKSKGGYKAVELAADGSETSHEVDGADEAIADGAVGGGEA